MFDDRLRLGEATLMVKPSCKTLTGRLEFSDPSVNFVFVPKKGGVGYYVGFFLLVPFLCSLIRRAPWVQNQGQRRDLSFMRLYRFILSRFWSISFSFRPTCSRLRAVKPILVRGESETWVGGLQQNERRLRVVPLRFSAFWRCDFVDQYVLTEFSHNVNSPPLSHSFLWRCWRREEWLRFQSLFSS